jgi:hypothetical protein
MHPSPDVLALLALGEEAGTPAERDHIGTCAQCQAEVSELARAVVAGRSGRTGESGLVTPPEQVWTAIRAELGFDPPGLEPDVPADPYGARELGAISTVTAQPRHARVERNGSGPDEPHAEQPAPRLEPEPRQPQVVDLGAARAARSSRGRRLSALVAAAAVALVLGLGLGLGLDRLLGPRQTTLWTAELQALPQFAGSTGQAIVQEDGQGKRTLVIDLDSPEPVAGSRQVWLIERDGERMRSLGYLNGDKKQFDVPPDVDPRQLPIVDVSEEPPSDSDLAHSGTSIVRGTLNV